MLLNAFMHGYPQLLPRRALRVLLDRVLCVLIFVPILYSYTLFNTHICVCNFFKCKQKSTNPYPNAHQVHFSLQFVWLKEKKVIQI